MGRGAIVGGGAIQVNASLFGASALTTPAATVAGSTPAYGFPGLDQQFLWLRGPGRPSAERRLSLARRQVLAAGRL